MSSIAKQDKQDKTTASRERTPWEKKQDYYLQRQRVVFPTHRNSWHGLVAGQPEATPTIIYFQFVCWGEKEEEGQAYVSVGGMELGDEPSHVADS